jgi:hypothetical protein
VNINIGVDLLTRLVVVDCCCAFVVYVVWLFLCCDVVVSVVVSFGMSPEFHSYRRCEYQAALFCPKPCSAGMTSQIWHFWLLQG